MGAGTFQKVALSQERDTECIEKKWGQVVHPQLTTECLDHRLKLALVYFNLKIWLHFRESPQISPEKWCSVYTERCTTSYCVCWMDLVPLSTLLMLSYLQTSVHCMSLARHTLGHRSTSWLQVRKLNGTSLLDLLPTCLFICRYRQSVCNLDMAVLDNIIIRGNDMYLRLSIEHVLKTI